MVSAFRVYESRYQTGVLMLCGAYLHGGALLGAISTRPRIIILRLKAFCVHAQCHRGRKLYLFHALTRTTETCSTVRARQPRCLTPIFDRIFCPFERPSGTPDTVIELRAACTAPPLRFLYIYIYICSPVQRTALHSKFEEIHSSFSRGSTPRPNG